MQYVYICVCMCVYGYTNECVYVSAPLVPFYQNYDIPRGYTPTSTLTNTRTERESQRYTENTNTQNTYTHNIRTPLPVWARVMQYVNEGRMSKAYIQVYTYTHTHTHLQVHLHSKSLFLIFSLSLSHYLSLFFSSVFIVTSHYCVIRICVCVVCMYVCMYVCVVCVHVRYLISMTNCSSFV